MTSDSASDSPTSDLTGRVALVTGGSRGIGNAIAQRLSAVGATTVIGDLAAPAEGAFGEHFVELNVAEESSVEAAMQSIVGEHGGLDIVVNNAGIMFEVDVESQTLDDWNRMLAVNLTGQFLVAKHAAPHLRASGHGAIVNVGSIEGFMCNPSHTAYAASKGGVHGLTKALAVDLGPSGIRCNAVAPGWIDTELNAAYVDSHPDRGLVIDELAKLHPVGHVGAPSDVGDVVAWLASDAARFVTGQIITIDGGRTARPTLPSMLWT